MLRDVELQRRSVPKGQQAVGESPAIKAIADLQQVVAGSANRAIENLRQVVAESAHQATKALQQVVAESAHQATKALQQVVAESAHQAVADLQEVVVRSSAIEAIESMRRALGNMYLELYQAALRYIDEHWADLETENPDHPPPALFVLASLGMSLGKPLYYAVRADDSELLDVLEPVLTNGHFIVEMQAAVQAAPYLNQIQKRHLTTALNWLSTGQYVDAYPPFYNGLEPAFYAAARALRVVDEKHRFLNKRGKATKVDDLFEDLVKDPRFKRFLRAWVFGQRGNPFRHGDVDDPSECRRQSLRLAVALIGWLELFGAWQSCDFQHRLEAAVSQRKGLLSA
jgi:hypothetical protein